MQTAAAPPDDVVLFDGNYLQAVRRGRWEFVRRKNTTGVVIIVAVTDEGELLFVEQYRPPVSARVVELPAGLAGDIAGMEDEDGGAAAARELEEECGYRPARIEVLTHGPVSAGLTSEVVTFYRAWELTRVTDGGGDHNEDIVVHRVPVGDVVPWLARRQSEGALVDPKVYAALYYLK